MPCSTACPAFYLPPSVCRFFDHGHSLNAVRKMKQLAVARLPKGEGERHTASVPTSGAQGSSGSTPVIGLVLLLVALAAYYVLTKQ